MVEYRRVRLNLDFPSLGLLKRCWFLYDACSCRLVSDLTYKISQRFGLKNPGSLRLFVDDFLLPPCESILVVRDNDIVSVKATAKESSKSSGTNDPVEPNSKKLKLSSPIVSSTSSTSTSSSLSSEENEKSQMKPSLPSTSAMSECDGQSKSNLSSSKATSRTQCHNLAIVKQQRSSWIRGDTSVKNLKGSVASLANLSTPASAKTNSSVTTFGPTLDSSIVKLKQKKKASASGGTHIHFESTSSSSSSSSSRSGSIPSESSSSSETGSEPSGHEKQSLQVTPAVVKGPVNRGRGKRPSCRVWPKTVGGVRDTLETLSAVYVRTPLPASLPHTGQQAKGRGRGQVRTARQGKRGRGSGRSNNKSTLEQQTKDSSQLSVSAGVQLPPVASASEEMISDVTTPLAPPPSTGMNGSSQQNLDQSSAGFVPNLLPAPMDFSALPDHKEAPNIGDKIAFKTLELTANYNPSYSDFKEGKVLAYRPSSQSVIVKLSGWCFHNEQEKAKELAVGKFSLSNNNKDISIDVESEVEVEFESMKSLKLIQ